MNPLIDGILAGVVTGGAVASLLLCGMMLGEPEVKDKPVCPPTTHEVIYEIL